MTDQRELYQLLDYDDAVDLRDKLAVWEEPHNVRRPYSRPEGADSLRRPQE